ncbi:Alkaline phosphatase [Bacteroidales bacterium Barb6XT]|nr:Alkaline phosphatase [Bacteroidales bacterium Barb6XT]
MKKMKKTTVLLAVLTMASVLFASCNDNSDALNPAPAPEAVFKTPKYILFLAEATLNDPAFKAAYNAQTGTASLRSSIGVGELNLRKFPVTGMASTYAEDRYVTCSAAEMAKKRGMKVGIVSSVSIDHATPACFYAHTPDRNNNDSRFVFSSHRF